MDKYMFYKSAVIACDAASIMIKQYGEACLAKARTCHDEERKAELEMMGEGLLWISKSLPHFLGSLPGGFDVQAFPGYGCSHPAIARPL